jgi:hypothetical protein
VTGLEPEATKGASRGVNKGHEFTTQPMAEEFGWQGTKHALHRRHQRRFRVRGGQRVEQPGDSRHLNNAGTKTSVTITYHT